MVPGLRSKQLCAGPINWFNVIKWLFSAPLPPTPPPFPRLPRRLHSSRQTYSALKYQIIEIQELKGKLSFCDKIDVIFSMGYAQ